MQRLTAIEVFNGTLMNLKKARENTENKVSKSSSDSGHPFACYLPPHIGILTHFIMRLLFSRIRIDFPHAALPRPSEGKDSIYIYINKYKSRFEFLFFHTRLRHEGLLHPGVGFDYRFIFWQPLRRLFRISASHIRYIVKHLAIPDPYKSGYIQDKLMSGEAGLVSLVEEKGFYRRFVKSKPDPLHYLIEIQKRTERPIYFIPQLMLFGRAPEKTRLSLIDMLFGTNENPGRIRRFLALIQKPRNIFIETSETVSLRDFLARPEVARLSSRNQAVVLRRELLDQINRHRQSITGPRLKSRLEIMEELLTRQDVQNFISDYAKEANVSIHRAHKQAAAYLDEIASNYNLKMIRIFDVALRWVFKNIFEGMVVDYHGLDRIKRISRHAPLILVPCHKSHLDYLILSYIFYNNNMPCPLIAAGRNLSFWPLGPVFRGGGAFFLRRTFKGEKLYPRVFAAYIQKIIDEGFYVEFFPEGGRSRTGKLLPPKVGLLKLILEAYQKIRWQDIMFVPIYIGYDRVLEEKAYIHELEGGRKKPENLRNVIKARKFLKKKYGKIYLNFNEPISLRSYLESRRDQREDGPPQPKDLSPDLGRRLIGAINQVTVVTPHSVLASAVLNCGQKRFYYNQLSRIAETYMSFLLSQGAYLSDTLIMDRNSAFLNVLETFVQNKMLEKSTTDLSSASESNPLFKVSENKRPGLEYYKNNSVICFIPAAFTALGIIHSDAFQFTARDLHEKYEFLRDLFAYEFIQPENGLSVADIVRKTLKSFIDDAALMPHPTLPETYYITSSGYRKLHMFAAFLIPFFDSYWVVLNFMRRYTRQHVLEVKDYIKKIQSLGNRMYKRGEITRKEALTKANYENAVSFFADRGLAEPEKNTEASTFYLETMQSYRQYLQEKIPLLT